MNSIGSARAGRSAHPQLYVPRALPIECSSLSAIWTLPRHSGKSNTRSESLAGEDCVLLDITRDESSSKIEKELVDPEAKVCYSVGFDLEEFDESAIAEEFAQRYGTDHHRIQLSEKQVIESVTEAVAKLDLPSVDAINTYIVARAVAANGVKVALSGLGGDPNIVIVTPVLLPGENPTRTRPKIWVEFSLGVIMRELQSKQNTKPNQRRQICQRQKRVSFSAMGSGPMARASVS